MVPRTVDSAKLDHRGRVQDPRRIDTSVWRWAGDVVDEDSGGAGPGLWQHRQLRGPRLIP